MKQVTDMEFFQRIDKLKVKRQAIAVDGGVELVYVANRKTVGKATNINHVIKYYLVNS